MGRVTAALVALAAALAAGCGRGANQVVDYLEHAELQCETEAQRQSVVGALEDILALSEAELRQRRYADYAGQPDAWDLPTLLSRHFVPDRQGRTLGPNFYSDAKSPAAQSLVRRVLGRLAPQDLPAR
jgi:hypothetical protein